MEILVGGGDPATPYLTAFSTIGWKDQSGYERGSQLIRDVDIGGKVRIPNLLESRYACWKFNLTLWILPFGLTARPSRRKSATSRPSPPPSPSFHPDQGRNGIEAAEQKMWIDLTVQ
jgi:hypothetical protein